MPHQPDAPDLTGLQPRYTWTTRRGVRILLFASISLQAVTAVVRLSSSPDAVDLVLSAVQLLAFVVVLGAYFVWTPGTLLTQDAVTVRKGFPGARAIPWTDVEGVRVQGRWQDVSDLLLRNGRTERLTGVPVEDARLLSEALAARNVH